MSRTRKCLAFLAVAVGAVLTLSLTAALAVGTFKLMLVMASG